MSIDIWIDVIILGIGLGLGFETQRWVVRRRERALRAEMKSRSDVEEPSELGVSVEVDCRACGKLNRVPSHRLRDRPKCGRCKVRLMPGKRLVLCRVSPMESSLQVDLDAAWKDEDRLWQCLADHVAIQGKARAEAQGARPRVVN